MSQIYLHSQLWILRLMTWRGGEGGVEVRLQLQVHHGKTLRIHAHSCCRVDTNSPRDRLVMSCIYIRFELRGLPPFLQGTASPTFVPPSKRFDGAASFVGHFQLRTRLAMFGHLNMSFQRCAICVSPTFFLPHPLYSCKEKLAYVTQLDVIKVIQKTRRIKCCYEYMSKIDVNRRFADLAN